MTSRDDTALPGPERNRFGFGPIRFLGYIGSPKGILAPMDKKARLHNSSKDRLRELIHENLAQIVRAFDYDRQHDILFHRLSSSIIPFASHPQIDLPNWRAEESETLDLLGRLIRNSGRRVSMHPGQFTVLNSPEARVFEASIRELEYHASFLTALGLDSTHKIVLHIGGVYEDRIASTARFIERALGLSAAVRERLILENDERGYTASEVASIAERVGVPAVFDWLHHQINPGLPEPVEEILARLLATWRECDGPPKLHYSGKAEVGRAGAHSEWIDPADFVAFARVVSRAISLAGKHQVDCMLEAKGKDLALLRLREDLTALSA